MPGHARNSLRRAGTGGAFGRTIAVCMATDQKLTVLLELHHNVSSAHRQYCPLWPPNPAGIRGDQHNEELGVRS